MKLINPQENDNLSETKKVEIEKAMQEAAERLARIFWKQWFEEKDKKQPESPSTNFHQIV